MKVTSLRQVKVYISGILHSRGFQKLSLVVVGAGSQKLFGTIY